MAKRRRSGDTDTGPVASGETVATGTVAENQAEGTQRHFPGMEPPRIKILDELAGDFREKRDDWQSRHAPMVEAKAKLLEAMAAHVWIEGAEDADQRLRPNGDGVYVYPIPGTTFEIVYTPERRKDPDVKIRTRRDVEDVD